MSRFAGLEINQDTLRIAIFEGTPKKYALVDFVEEEVSSESPEERRQVVSDILTEVFSRKENKGVDVVSGIDARNAVLREITVPYTRDDAIAKTIKFEAEGYLHAHSVDDVVIEYVKCGEVESGSRLILCALQKSKLLSHLDTLQGANVDPVAVELDATALATSFANTPLHSGEQNVLLVELQPDYSRLVFLEKDRLVKIRSFWSNGSVVRRPDRLLPEDTEGDDATEKVDLPAGSDIERRFEELERSLDDIDDSGGGGLGPEDIPVAVITDDEYERLTERQSAQVATSVEAPSDSSKTMTVPTLTREGDPLDRLILEIERTFAAYVLTHPIDLVVVTGQCAEELDAVARLAEYFEVDVVPFDLGDSYPIKWDGDVATLNRRGAVTCGLGLRALGHGFADFDLRKEEFRFERRFQRLMPAMTLLGLLLCVVSLLWSVKLYNDSSRLKQEIMVLQLKQAEYYEAFFEEKAKMPSATSPTPIFAQAKNKLKEHAGGATTKNRKKIKQSLRPLEVVQDVTAAIGMAKPAAYPVYKNFDLSLLVSDRSKSTLKLGVKDNDESIRIRHALKQHSKLFDVEVDYKTAAKGNEASVELQLKAAVAQQRGQ